jgi:hypothetical protein
LCRIPTFFFKSPNDTLKYFALEIPILDLKKFQPSHSDI